ncbi:alpha/beta hydrolase [Gordonia hankookensis]|uniref:Alpha/beta hydrolase n=1 Tax=Gordonia hankookensis TaxID=589403 RepID=A0ABR7W7V8_9ACTN|nr:alpha/beta hydrolase [Gordonia hankookensis]MBD1318906.1 alpha/beta hydrolase [Gordonia hankookensis]NDZ94426.1 alpha/beta hydrolase [Streptomyces sp. SID11726]NEB24924.1 alpha/beta hydrolase [Streptomyces sp. SID6673]
MTTTRTTITFDSHGTGCDAWYFPGADSSEFDTPAGRPVVVMAHGFAGTKDSGLEPYAQRLADAGLAVFAFDYRGFGLSGGEPRQRISMAGQADDYRAAIVAAKRQEGVDPERVILWGVSQSGGHTLVVAAGRSDVCAVIAMVPLVNGLAAGVHHYPQVGAAAMARSTAVGIGSALAGKMGRPPTMMPVVGRPGEKAALTSPGFYEDYLAIAGPSWRNEVDASIGLELGNFRADKSADAITAPVLMQIADFDQGAPPHAAAKAGFKARAEVRHYPCDHFDVFAGRDWFEPAVAHQLSFLTAHLTSASETAATGGAS